MIKKWDAPSEDLLKDFVVFLLEHDALLCKAYVFLGRERYTYDAAIAKYWETFQ